MALRALNSVVATNYAKLSTDPVLAGDFVVFSSNSNATSVNPAGVFRADRYNSVSGVISTPVSQTAISAAQRGFLVGVSADDAVGTNPAGETPTMINNDPAGSNFLNGSVFQSYTAGFYVGAKRAISDFKDESVDVVTNLTAGIPLYSQRGVSVYTTPSSQFVTDRFVLTTAQTGNSNDTGSWTGTTGSTAPAPGDLLTIGSSNGNATVASPYAGTVAPTSASATTNNRGLLVSASTVSVPIVGRVDFYDSGAGLLYWTLL
jgi:hypothetical protein